MEDYYDDDGILNNDGNLLFRSYIMMIKWSLYNFVYLFWTVVIIDCTNIL